jgi:hypothetical protein
MSTVLILVIVVLMIMVAVSLVRGIVAFMKSTKLDLEDDRSGTGASEMQLMQNKMMFARIKYQAAAVLVCALLFAISK